MKTSPSRSGSLLTRVLHLFRLGIGDMNRAIVLTLGISPVKNVMSFRSSVISLVRLRSNRLTAQRDSVGLKHLPLGIQDQLALFLQNDNRIGTCIRRKRSNCIRFRKDWERRQYCETEA